MLKDFIKTGQQEGKEKHVPFIGVSNCSACGELSVVVKVGAEILHPATPEHYIETITLFGVTKEDKIIQITRFELAKENTVPYVKTHIKKDIFKKIIAVSICNLHGIWENEVEVL